MPIVAAFASGTLWLHAALIKVPTNIQSGYGAIVGVEEMSAGFRRQSIWNSYAPGATAAAAILQISR